MRRTRIDFSQPYDVQKLVSGVGQTLSDVQRKLGAHQGWRNMKKTAVEFSEEGRSRLHEAADSLRAGGTRVTDRTRVSVRERPLLMMFSALVAGVLLGRFFLGK